MPRSLFDILLEKDPYLKKNKNQYKDLEYQSSEAFYGEVTTLYTLCVNIVTSRLAAIGAFGGLEIDKLKTLKEDFTDYSEELKKLEDESSDYPWNDKEVQDKLIELKKDIEESLALLDKVQAQSLGKDESYRIANNYYDTAESLRQKATEKILRIASLRDKETKSDSQRANTDLTRNNELNSDKMDIVAKKENAPVDKDGNPISETTDAKDAREKRNKELEAESLRIKAGMFYYLRSITGETKKEFDSKWDPSFDVKVRSEFASDAKFKEWEDTVDTSKDPKNTKTNKARAEEVKGYRLELLKRGVPFLEQVTGVDYDETNPFKDKQYINDLMVLGRYTPGYKDYAPDPEDEVEDNKELTEAEKAKVKAYVDGVKTKILELIQKIEDNNPGNSLKEKKVKEEIGFAKIDLNSVEPSTACDISSRKALREAKKDLEKKIETYSSLLDKEKDIKPMEEIILKIEEVLTYCKGQEYKK
jgi:hypothetical protein